MSITRINEFQSAPDQATELREFLASVIASIIDAPGCQACELLQHHHDPARLAIIERWDSIEAHQAAASRIPPDKMKQAMALFAKPPQGAYYRPVGATGG